MPCDRTLRTKHWRASIAVRLCVYGGAHKGRKFPHIAVLFFPLLVVLQQSLQEIPYGLEVPSF